MRPSNMGHSHGRGILGPGPLMTNHLKVRNLDRELDALRRKREIIQREQEMLNLECDMDRKRQYEQANRNVQNMYGKAWQPPPPKRANFPQQVKPWRAPAQDYTMNMSKPMPSNYIPSLLDSKVDMPRRPFVPPAPMHKPIVHPILQDSFSSTMLHPAPNVRNNYGASMQTNKVMKMRPQNPPNKLNSYPVNKRKDLVSSATDKPILAFKKTFKGPETSESLMLREGQKPSQRVIGRLELALGSLVKELRNDNIDNDQFTLLMSKHTTQRVLKQAIRERIRIVMLNQLVTSVTDIVNKYRQKFPKETDKDILDLVINKPDNMVETENPEEFLKKYIDSILERKLKEISLKLKLMYKKVNRTNIDLKSITLDEIAEKESAVNSEEAKKIIRDLTGKYVTPKECSVLAKFYTDLIEDILEKKLPKHLPKHKDLFFNIFNLDHKIDSIKGMATNSAGKQNETNNVSSNNNAVIEMEHNEMEEDTECNSITEQEAPESNDIVVETISENRETQENSGTQKSTETSSIETNPVLIEGDEAKDMAPVETQENSGTQKSSETSSIETNSVLIDGDEAKDMAPVVVPVVPPKPVDSPKPETPVPNKTHLQSPTSETATETATPVSNKTQVTSVTTTPATTTPKKTEPSVVPKTPNTTPSGKELPYYIKLIGRPTLPARPVICDFLNNYQPTSIKKHKSINNLLVIGFNNEDDYNKILKANETVIGGITIIIKGSEKVSSGKDNESTQENNGVQKDNGKEINANAQKVTKDISANEVKNGKDTEKEVISTTEEQNDDSKDLIGKELDDEITDLLSTIREADKDKTEDNSNKAPIETNDNVSQESSDVGKGSLATDKEGETAVENGDKNNSDKVKVSKAVGTPARSSSRLANLTPSTIRTRRASRLMQEQ